MKVASVTVRATIQWLTGARTRGPSPLLLPDPASMASLPPRPVPIDRLQAGGAAGLIGGPERSEGVQPLARPGPSRPLLESHVRHDRQADEQRGVLRVGL